MFTEEIGNSSGTTKKNGSQSANDCSDTRTLGRDAFHSLVYSRRPYSSMDGFAEA